MKPRVQLHSGRQCLGSLVPKVVVWDEQKKRDWTSDGNGGLNKRGIALEGGKYAT